MARAQVEVVAVDDVRSVDGQSMLREVSSLWMTQRVDQGMSPEAATRAAADQYAAATRRFLSFGS